MFLKIRNGWRNLRQTVARNDGQVLIALREFFLALLRGWLTSGNIGLRAVALVILVVLLTIVEILRLLRFLFE